MLPIKISGIQARASCLGGDSTHITYLYATKLLMITSLINKRATHDSCTPKIFRICMVYFETALRSLTIYYHLALNKYKFENGGWRTFLYIAVVLYKGDIPTTPRSDITSIDDFISRTCVLRSAAVV